MRICSNRTILTVGGILSVFCGRYDNIVYGLVSPCRFNSRCSNTAVLASGRRFNSRCSNTAVLASGRYSSRVYNTNSNDNNHTPDIEAVWRYVKKPLLRIGAKGATSTHGNSLRELLLDHTVVKVKINPTLYEGSLMKAYEVLKEFAISNGASKEMELLHIRTGEQVILVALPGTLARIEAGEFPPPPPTETNIMRQDEDDQV